jgi:hypothetical protein
VGYKLSEARIRRSLSEAAKSWSDLQENKQQGEFLPIDQTNHNEKTEIAPENYVFELMLYAGFWHNISVWLKWRTNSQKLAGSAEVQSAAKN